MNVLADLLKDVVRQRADLDIVYHQQNEMHASEWAFHLGGKMQHYAMYCRRLVSYLLDNGVTVHVAINRAGGMAVYQFEEDAQTWAFDPSVTGDHTPSIQPFIMALKIRKGA